MSEGPATRTDLDQLRRALAAIRGLRAKVEALEGARSEPLAVVGIGCRFPGGAEDPESFWEMLRAGVDAVREFPRERWDVDLLYDPDPDAPGKSYVREGALLADVHSFDAGFFGISPREVAAMDPQQRLLLEVAWEALEDAAIPPATLEGTRTGVFVGVMNEDWSRLMALRGAPEEADAYVGTGSDISFMAGRLSYVLGLQGPSVVLATACSSSLVALHLAAQSLRARECRVALAGGVSLILSPDTNVILSKMRALAPDGRCKTFDAAADGYGRGEGCGVLVLKRLADALADGDRVHVVVRGSAIGHDGRSNGLTAPNGAAQEAVLSAALEDARVEAVSVGYVEAHGTGTSLGDPIEVAAIAEVLGKGRPAERPLALGSVKTNFGHLEAAAGVAGIVKAALVLKHGEVPPHLHLSRPNPLLPLASAPFTIPTAPTLLAAWDGPRRAGVSSFGLSGINAHVVLEEPPSPAGPTAARPVELLLLSARSESALRALAGRYASLLRGAGADGLPDVCATAAAGRTPFPHRLAVPARTATEAAEALEEAAAGRTPSGTRTGVVPALQAKGESREADDLPQPPAPDAGEAAWGAWADDLAGRWVAGEKVPIRVLLGERAFRKVRVPTTVFERHRFVPPWEAEGKLFRASADSIHPLLGRRVPIALAPASDRRFEALLSAASPPFLADHRVHGAVLFPAAGFAEMALVAAREATGTASVAQLELVEALVLPESRSLLVQTVVEEAGGVLRVTVASAVADTVASAGMGRETRDAAAWTVHARGTLGPEAGPEALEEEDLGSVRARCTTEVRPDALYAGLSARGLGYGPRFRSVRSALRRDGEALVSLEVPPRAAGAFVLHPVLLDGCFQSIGLALGPEAGEETHLPVELSGLRVVAPVPAAVLAHVRVSRSDRGLSATVRLFDAAGASPPVAEVRVRLVPVAAPASAHPREEWREWLNGVGWSPRPLRVPGIAAERLPSPASLAAEAAAAAGDRPWEGSLREAERRLDAEAGRQAARALTSLGWKIRRGQRLSLSSIGDQLGVGKEKRRLLGRLLEMLEEDGLLASSATPAPASSASAAEERRWEVVGDPGESGGGEPPLGANEGAADALLARCAEVLPGVLMGASDPLETLFPAAADGAALLYGGTAVSSFFNGLVADVVGRAVASWPAGPALRLLEVGGGTGSATEALLGRLPGGLAEYTFTDVSPYFVHAAQERWKEVPLFSASPLDVEKEPAPQGFRAGAYDVVVAANVLHATSDLRVTLRHLRELLAPGGLLVLLEVTRPSRWMDLVFGLTDGWWRFADTEIRPAHPLLPAARWLDLLAAEGFEEPHGIPGDAPDPAGGTASTVLLARRPAPAPPRDEPAAEAKRAWLLVGGEASAAAELAGLLAARGSEGRLLAPRPGEEPAPFAVRLSSAIDGMLEAGGLAGVLHLWALEGRTSGHPYDAQERLLGAALAAAKALARREESGARLVLVTRGARPGQDAWAANGGGGRVDVAGATLWGFGTAVATEHPRLSLLRVDLDPAAGPSCAPLLHELLFPDRETLVAYRGRLRLTGRLERLEVAAAGEVPVRADGTYLVTGGLGGLGLVTAGWLASRGARSLALSGRQADEPLLPEETRRELSRLRSDGVTVRLFSADVGREGEVDRLLAEIRGSLPPLRGVVHAAGVLSDSLLERQEWPSFATVLAPKVRGAWDLSEGTASDPLDLFVLFSSMAGTLGGAGQSNHAAASAFLDALAHDRRARGLPALSIDWGPWSEVGEAVRLGADDRLGRAGIGAIDPARGAAILDLLVRAGLPQAGVLPVDWHALVAVYGEGEVPKFLEEISRGREEAGRPAAERPTNLLARLREAEPSARPDLLARHLAREAGKILGLAPDAEPDPSLPLQDLGLDSLMALELKNSAEFLLGISFPLARLLRGASARDLAGEILPALEAQLAGPPEASGPAASLEPDRAHRFDPFPLTDIQMAYWVGRNEAIELGSVGCHFYAEFDGSFDPGRLSRAWGVLVEWHGMLRAVVTPDGMQKVLPEVPPYEIATLDLAESGREESERALSAVRGEMAAQLFDPERWPLFDLRATRLPGGRVRLHVSLDLLIVDAAGIFQLMEEWAGLTAAGEGTGGGEAAGEGPALDFRDYVLHAEAFRSSEVYRRSEAYWRGRIETLPRAPELPRVGAPSGPPVFVRRTGSLSSPRWKALTGKAEREGLTPSGLLCAAYAEVLGRFSRSPRFTLNLTTFQRYPFHPDVSRLIGDFTSTLLLAVEPSEAGFSARARALQARLEEDLDHVHVGGVRVLRDWSRLHGEGPGASMPVIFTSLLGYARGERRGDPSRTPIGEMAYAVSQTPQVWIDHQAFEDSEGLHFNWDSVDALFPAGLTEGMFGAYEGLLEALASGEEAWEGDPELVPAGQLSARREANATAGTVPEGLLHEPFERQAASRPEAVALASSRRRMSYGELEGDANALGRRLRGLGVGPGKLAAVVMEKGWEQVVGVLGILKAGGAYLPVDAGLPVERIAYLLRNGGVSVAVVQPWVAGRLEFPAGVEVVTVAEPEGAGGSESAGASRLEAQAKPEDVAYVIYTSGSTGEPKGVVIDHRGALNTCVDVNRTHGIGPGDRVLGISSLSFDLSVWDLFGVLGAGGTVVLPEPEAQRDPSRWLSLMESEGVTVWNSVPALVEMLTTYVGGGRLPESLRLVLMSGDWIPVTLPGAIRRAGRDGIELVSMGGATEASIWSIRYPIGAVGEGWTSIPYGRAMANQGFHVLDGGMRERPEWVAGELYIGGIGLAKGYLGDAEKTAAKFVIHPKTGERLYRTGDWGRWLPGGVIEFLGREDQQVKVQGHRIELGEVEAALGRLPGVAAVAVAVAGEGSDRRLVAFFVPRAGEGTEGLAEALGAILPSHMVPSGFVALDALPMTGNGKLDRAALARLAVGRSAPRRAVVAPRNGVEETLVRIWSEVLGVAEVSVEDDFFSLGGNSLAVIAVHNRIRDAFPREVPIVEMFRRPTVAALARLLAPPEERAAPAAPRPEARPAVVVQFARARPPFFFIPGALGATVYLEDLARRLGADQTFYGLQMPGVDGHEAPLDSIEELAGRFVQAVRSVHPDGPYLLGGQSSGGMVAFEMARQLRAAGASVPYVGMLDTYFIANRRAMSFQDDASVSDILVRVFCNIFGSALTGDPAGTVREAREWDGGAPGAGASGGPPLPPTAQLEALLDRLQSRGLVSRALVVRGLLEVFKASLRAIARYEPSLYDGPLHVYRSEKGIPERFSDVDVVVEAPDPGESWAPYSTRPVSVVTVPGDHISMIWEPNVALLGALMRADLDAALKEAGESGRREGR